MVSFRKNKDGSIKGPWEKLDRFVGDELPRPSPDASTASEEHRLPRDVELEEFRVRRRERLAASALPTYSATSARTQVPTPPTVRSFRGRAAACPGEAPFTASSKPSCATRASISALSP